MAITVITRKITRAYNHSKSWEITPHIIVAETQVQFGPGQLEEHMAQAYEADHITMPTLLNVIEFINHCDGLVIDELRVRVETYIDEVDFKFQAYSNEDHRPVACEITFGRWGLWIYVSEYWDAHKKEKELNNRAINAIYSPLGRGIYLNLGFKINDALIFKTVADFIRNKKYLKLFANVRLFYGGTETQIDRWFEKALSKAMLPNNKNRKYKTIKEDEA